MATPLTMIFLTIVGLSLAPLGGIAGKTAESPVTCTLSELTKISVSQPGAKLILKCPAEAPHLWPLQTKGSPISNVGTNSKCDQVASLNSVCPGASGTCASNDTLAMEVSQLPKPDAVFFFSCQDQPPTGKAAASKGCSFEVTVKAYSPQGPQVCANLGSSIDLAVAGYGGRAQFGCGDNMTLNPSDPKKIFGGDCVKEENLKDLERTTGTDGYYVLTATKKPATKKYCYLCAQSSRATGQSGTNCAILISVSAASGFAARSTFGLALSCVLAVLHFA